MLPRISALIAILFFIWILPLGFFIKPSQEKMACNGQRAICLCTHTKAKVKNNPIAGFGLKASSENNKESNASGGGAGHYYVIAQLSVMDILNRYPFTQLTLLVDHNPFLKSIEHIPKA